MSPSRWNYVFIHQRVKHLVTASVSFSLDFYDVVTSESESRDRQFVIVLGYK